MARSGGLRVLLCVAVSLFILSTILLSNAGAKVGYVIDVDVDGTHWSRSQYTEVLNFKSESECSGKGNSSKYVNVPGFAGIGLKELTYTKQGRLATKSALNLSAKFNWIYIDELVNGAQYYNETIDDSTNDTINISRQADDYYAEINESIPTLLRTDDQIAYRGEGIYTRNSYTSDEDRICTSYQATNLSKAARFAGVYSNSLIRVHVSPGNVDELQLKNTATAFRVLSSSDRYSRLGYRSGKTYSDEVYVGSFNIDRTISKRTRFNLTSVDVGWLGCCPPDTDFVKLWAWDCDCIFDAHSPIPYLTK